MNSNDIILEAKKIKKQFSGVVVLDDVDFSLKKGEVHALLGENGAGKSTLVKILTGAYRKDSGMIYMDGKEVSINNTNDAINNGISIIYQEFSQVDSLSVGENLFLRDLPYNKMLKGFIKIIDWKKIFTNTEKELKEYGIIIKPQAKIRNLGVAEKQIIEIIKAIRTKSKILIMDEPTSALSVEEIEHLFEVIQTLKNQGISIIYISHRLDEVKRICDRATVIKDGQVAGTCNLSETKISEIIKMMIGRNLNEMFPVKKSSLDNTALEISDFSKKNKFSNISFNLKNGEILGIVGLVGSGKTELVRAICGIDIKDSGEIIIDGKKNKIDSMKEAIKFKIGLLPEDRNSQGVISCLSINDNISLPSLKRFSKLGFLNVFKESREVKKHMKNVNVRPYSPQIKVKYLSGGNKQKVVLAKWLCNDSKVYIFDEPTRGIDVGAKSEIYKLMRTLADNKSGIIMISSEIEEIIGMCNRVLIMRKGILIMELVHDEITKEKIMTSMMGGLFYEH